MPEKDAFADRKKLLEEDYFRKKEQELIEKARRRAAAEAERREMAEATGIADDEILNDLQELGYNRETVALLHLAPLVQVAWAEGFVTKRERNQIFEAAGIRGISEDSSAYKQLTEWLEKRPSDEFFQKTIRIIGHIMQSLPEKERESSKDNLMTYCLKVASASGGILGFGRKVSDIEQEVIERIAAELERDHNTAARRVLEEN